ncbi:MAG: hypothetical protein KUG82_12905 [Pseudomonadales bacterium]|nr:hypothetical protein [Pseudomonadales bacterium]
MFEFIKNLATKVGHEFTPNLVSKIAINHLANTAQHLPSQYSLWSYQEGKVCDYVSWSSLTDKSYTGRLLGPAAADVVGSLPLDPPFQSPLDDQYGQVTALFKRKQQIDSDRTSLLFPFFAQWFTDGLIRADNADPRKNASNHEIDLCQIYGLTESTTRILRSMEKGKLRSQLINSEEFPDYLYGENGEVKSIYQNLPYVLDNRLEEIINQFDDAKDRKPSYFATGLESGNSSVGYTTMSTIFLREHNRLCDELASQNTDWDDERLFQTARNINIVLLLKVVVEDYVNHISPIKTPIFKLDNTVAEDKKWNQPGRVSFEFDLLYRWSSLIPDQMKFGSIDYDYKQFMLNNTLLTEHGLAKIVNDASHQRAGKLSLSNTPDFLLGEQHEAIKMARSFQTRSLNEYRILFGLEKFHDFNDVTSDAALSNRLQGLYGHVDYLELFTGLSAEGIEDNAIFGELMTTMVVSDALTHALTNPLLAKQVFNSGTFTRSGMNVIENTSSLQDITNRNLPSGARAEISFGF